jgi:hypothetical protein
VPMKLMTWNLRGNGGGSPAAAHERFLSQVAYIAHAAPDVLGLQQAPWRDADLDKLLTFEALTGLRAFPGHETPGTHTVLAVRPQAAVPLTHQPGGDHHSGHNKVTVLVPGCIDPIALLAPARLPFTQAAHPAAAVCAPELAAQPSITLAGRQILLSPHLAPALTPGTYRVLGDKFTTRLSDHPPATAEINPQATPGIAEEPAGEPTGEPGRAGAFPVRFSPN